MQYICIKKKSSVIVSIYIYIYIINQISLIPTTTVNQVQKKICLISKHFKQEQIVL